MFAAEGLERVRRGPPRGAEDVPRSPQEIGREWLTAALCARTPGARVCYWTGIRGSVGTTSRQAFEVAYNDAGTEAGLPTRVFVKCTSTLAQRLMLGLGGLIDGEPGFYRHIRPGLGIEAPVGYFAAVDRLSWHSIVVIEDVIGTRGASFWGPTIRITREQIENLLANMAVLHGTLWESTRLAKLAWLKTPLEQMRVIDALIGMADRTRAGVERARVVIPSAVLAHQGDLYEAMRRSMEIMSGRPRTYLHGDLHIANTYLMPANRVGIADWQVGLQGSWAHDFAYLVTTALPVEDRRAWERDLLGYYLERLAVAGGEAIRWERAWRAYRQATLYPYFAWLYTIGRSRLQPNFQPQKVSLTMIERIAGAIDDLDSFGVLRL